MKDLSLLPIFVFFFSNTFAADYCCRSTVSKLVCPCIQGMR